MSKPTKAYGLDLGCSSCCTAFVDENNTPVVVNLHSTYSSNTIPSYVCYDSKSDKVMVGSSALNKLSNKNFNVLYNSKQFIGKKWERIDNEKLKTYSFEMVEKDGIPQYKLIYNNKETYLSPVDVTSEIIKEINKITLNRVAGKSISSDDVEVVIGIPSAFKESQRDGIISSAKKAGLKNIDTIYEQEAVALAYITLNKKELMSKGNCKFLICDFGGNCFNASIVEYKNKEINIIGRYGEDNIGGEEITKILEEKIKKEIKEKVGIDVNQNKIQKVRVHKACEEAKIYLSYTNEYEMTVLLDKDKEFTKKINKKYFHLSSNILLNKTINVIDILLERRDLHITDINYVICVGGSSRIPEFEKRIKKRMNKIPLLKSISPDEAVGIGCAIHANNKIKGIKSVKIIEYIPPNRLSFCISVGIDTISSAYSRYDESECISFNDGNTFIKNIVSFSKNSDMFICGMDSRGFSVVSDAMKYIGKKYKDINQFNLRQKPYKLVEGKDGYCLYEVLYNNETKYYSPTEILSMILEYIKQHSADVLGIENKNDVPVIITIPANLDHDQINEFRKAAKMVGLKVERLITEPVAAAFAYISKGLINKNKCNILIADFGDSSFKSSIFNLNGNDMKIISYSENDTICGNAIREILVSFIVKDIKKTIGVDVYDKPKLIDRIKKNCEDITNCLANCDYYSVDLCVDGNDYEKVITKTEFNNLISPIIDRTIYIINNSINYGKVKDIDYIVLIGGSSRIPSYRELIKSRYYNIPILDNINPQEAFAVGGTMYSHSYYDENSYYYRINEVLLRSISIGIKQTKKPEISYGIDLGTTYSSSAYVGVDSNIHVINPSESRSNSIPSCVCYEKNNSKVTYGLSAQKNPKLKNGEATLLYDSKRLIGKEIYDIDEDELFSYPFEIIEKDDNPYYKVINNKSEMNLSPIDISSEIINYIHTYSIPQITKDKIDPSDVQVIIGVPAAFTNDQRRSTIEAAEKAKIENVDLLSEPTAAALSYIYSGKIEKKECKILVYDFGGGTFDVSVIELKDKDITILGTFGDEHLGGEDITMRIEENIKKDIKERIGIDVNENERYKLRIHTSCEEIKKQISSSEEATISLEFEDEEYEKTIIRKEFNEICEDLFEKTIKVVKYSLERVGLKDDEIDYFILVGGSSLIPRIEELLKENFKMSNICKSDNTEEDVSKGCAIYSESLQNKEYNKYNVNDKSSIYSEDGKKYSIDGYILTNLIERQTILPYRCVKTIKCPKECNSLKIYQDELNSTNQIEIGEIKIGKHENEEIEIEIEGNSDGLLSLSINVDDKKIKSEIEFNVN